MWEFKCKEKKRKSSNFVLISFLNRSVYQFLQDKVFSTHAEDGTSSKFSRFFFFCGSLVSFIHYFLASPIYTKLIAGSVAGVTAQSLMYWVTLQYLL
jgi:hypothetical protein